MLFLLEGMQASVALYVRYGSGKGQATLLKIPALLLDAFHTAGPQFLIHHLGGHAEGDQCIGAQTVNKHAPLRSHARHIPFMLQQHAFRRFRRGEENTEVIYI